MDGLKSQVIEKLSKNLWPRIKRIENINLPKMDFHFIGALQRLADYVDRDILINRGAATSGHSSRSQHYKVPCECADFVIEDFPLDDAFRIAALFEGGIFRAVGAYPFWNTPGLHVDMREEPVYWYRKQDGEYYYSVHSAEIENILTGIPVAVSEIDFCSADF
jgi:hypothetical protein